MVDKKGLWIGGKSIERNNRDLQTVLKYALVQPNQRNNPAFQSDQMDQVLSLVDDLSVEIALAMIDDHVAHEFTDSDELADNIALRKGVIGAMRSICAGEIDGDYVEALDGVPPTLGYLRNLEVLFAPGATTGKGILTKQLPFTAPDDAWIHLPDNDSWSGYVFMQKPGMPLSETLTAITPFRGECAGALQLAVLLGYLNGVGAVKLDALTASYGSAFIGAWSFPSKDGTADVHTLASRFLTQLTKVPTTYERGSVIAVPGDYLYFQNKDDYPTRAPIGGWRGENCIYMGQDSLGAPHYSGLGLGWKTEFALRMFLCNAYLNDANTMYLEQRRSGEKSDIIPQFIEDAEAQVRFTKRAVMRCPDVGVGVPQEMLLPSANPAGLDDHAVRAQLDLLSFQNVGDNQFQQTQITLSKLMEALEIGDSQMLQAPSSALGGSGLVVNLGHWTLRIQPLDPAIEHLSAADAVHVHAVHHG